MKKLLLLGLGLCILAVLWGVLNSRKLPTLELTQADIARHKELWKAAEEMRDKAKRGELPWRYTDFRTVGNVEEEGQLLRLLYRVEMFEDVRGALPKSMAELAEHGNVEEESRNECELFLWGHDQVILNCDGWRLPQGDQGKQLVESFTSRTVKFYSLNGHVILYVPPFEKLGKPSIP